MLICIVKYLYTNVLITTFKKRVRIHSAKCQQCVRVSETQANISCANIRNCNVSVNKPKLNVVWQCTIKAMYCQIRHILKLYCLDFMTW